MEEGQKYGGKSQSNENNVCWHIYVHLVEDGTNSGPISCLAFVEEKIQSEWTGISL